MGKKMSKDVVFCLTLLAIVSFFFVSFFKSDKPAEYSKKEIKNNICMINEFNYSKVETVENRIKKLKSLDTHSNFQVGAGLSNAQYKKIFNNCVIVGDSITEGLTAYGYLGDDVVLSKIGASLLSSEDLFNSAADLKPNFAFFALGMNDTGYFNGKADAFATKYKNLLLSFKKSSPKTHIYVNSILPPSDSTLAARPSLGRYLRYNAALKEMCKELEIDYIDNTSFLTKNPDFYAGDGIHVSSKFYPLWLDNMIMKAGL